MSFSALAVCALAGLLSSATLVAQSSDSESPSPAAIDKRIFGVLPNYRTADGSLPYVPLTVRRKFYIGLKDSTDYPIFMLSGVFAGISHAQGTNPSFGGGVAGFSKRLGAAYADQGMGNLLAESAFPAMLREDPRYFRRGTGSMASRTKYALTRILITRTDQNKTRFNFSEVLGTASATAFSNVYSPDTRTAPQNAQKFGIQLATDALGGVLKEFWPDVKRKFFTRHT